MVYALSNRPHTRSWHPIQLLGAEVLKQGRVVAIQLIQAFEQFLSGSNYLAHGDSSQPADQQLALIDHFGRKVRVKQNEQLLVADDFLLPCIVVDLL